MHLIRNLVAYGVTLVGAGVKRVRGPKRGANCQYDCDGYRAYDHRPRPLMTAVPTIFIFGLVKVLKKVMTCNFLARLLSFVPALCPSSVGLVPFPEPEQNSY